MAHKVKVSYTRRYYKTITKEIEISGMLGEDEVEQYLHDNFPKEEIHEQSLDFEEDEFYIDES